MPRPVRLALPAAGFALAAIAAIAVFAAPVPPPAPTATVAPAAAAGEPVVRTYKVFLGGREAGTFEETALSDNGWEVRRSTYSFDDRGRGVHLGAGVVFEADGLPMRIQVHGTDYWKSPVDETFERKDGRSSWKSAAESGQGERGFYILRDSLPGELPALVRALRRAPEMRLPLLPEGEASVAEVARLSVEALGRVVPLTLYAVAGLDLGPRYVWLDADGELFASLSGGFEIVRAGGEKSRPDLLRRQDAAVAAGDRDLGARLGRRPAGPFAIRNARAFDPQTGEVRAGTTVVVRGDRIQIVGADGEVEIPADAEVVDAAGKTLLPGLWDMHVHLSPGSGLLYQAAGVTTVRDLGNDPRYLQAATQRFDQGTEIGPRVIAAGILDGPGPYAAPTTNLVSTEAEAVAAVDRYADAGYAQVKLYSSLPPALVPAIAARAHRRGLRISGHIPYGLTAERAVTLGFDEIQHANFLFLNFWPEVDTRTPARFLAVGGRASSLDLGSPAVAAFLRLLKKRGTVVDPTLNVFEDLFQGKAGQPPPSVAAVAARFPFQVRRGLGGGALDAPAGQEAAFRAAFPSLVAMVRKLRSAGIPIVAGTDATPGYPLIRELELYVDAGYSPREALQIATLGAARVMKRDAELGSIAPGKLADLILVDGDPTREIGDLRKVMLTVRGGVIYDPAKLGQAVGVAP
jgi:hypothetical protein